MAKAKYEEKFLVLPAKYYNGLTGCEIEIFDTLLDKIQDMRDNGSYQSYYICNQDEPYAEEVLRIILKGEDAKADKHMGGE